MTPREGGRRGGGEPQQIESVRRLFEQLDRARRDGVSIRKHEFNYALRTVNGADETPLDELSGTKITVSSKRGPIVPKSATQREYIKTISAEDMVFGIG